MPHYREPGEEIDDNTRIGPVEHTGAESRGSWRFGPESGCSQGRRAVSPNLITKLNDNSPSEYDFYSVWIHFTGRKWCILGNRGLECVVSVHLPGPDISLRNFNFCLRWDRGVDEFRRQRWQYVSDYMAFVHWVLIYTHMDR